jgi:hypothetical protein
VGVATQEGHYNFGQITGPTAARGLLAMTPRCRLAAAPRAICTAALCTTLLGVHGQLRVVSSTPSQSAARRQNVTVQPPAVCPRAANSRGPGGPTGPLRTPSRTPRTLSREGTRHRKRARASGGQDPWFDCKTYSCSLSYHPRSALAKSSTCSGRRTMRPPTCVCARPPARPIPPAG